MELCPGAWRMRQQLESWSRVWRWQKDGCSQRMGVHKGGKNWCGLLLIAGQDWEAQWLWQLRSPEGTLLGEGMVSFKSQLFPLQSLGPLLAYLHWVASINVIPRHMWDLWIMICQGKTHCSCLLARFYVIKCSLCSHGECIYFFEWTSGSTKTIIIPWERFRQKLQVWKTPLKGHLSLWFVACHNLVELHIQIWPQPPFTLFGPQPYTFWDGEWSLEGFLVVLWNPTALLLSAWELTKYK